MDTALVQIFGEIVIHEFRSLVVHVNTGFSLPPSDTHMKTDGADCQTHTLPLYIKKRIIQDKCEFLFLFFSHVDVSLLVLFTHNST